jgi:hypothetical protein
MVDSQGVIGIQPKPQLVRGVELMLQKGSLYRRLPSCDVRSLVGKLNQVVEMYEGRVGRGQTFVLTESLGEKELTADNFVQNLELHLCLMRLEPFRSVKLFPWRRQRLTFYSDASCEPQTPPLLPRAGVCDLIVGTVSARWQERASTTTSSCPCSPSRRI